MPRGDSIFLLGQVIVAYSDGTNLLTSGINFCAPISCDIFSMQMNARTMTTTDVLTVEMYPISAAVGAPSAVVASAMFSIGSGAFGSYGGHTVREVIDPVAGSTVGRHLNRLDMVNVAWTTGGTAANIKQVVVQVWAQAKR